MNQMDENYWIKLAQDWIKRQSQQNDIPNIPEAPKISFDTDSRTNCDNLAITDMEIEDVKDDHPTHDGIWNSQHPAAFSSIQTEQFLHTAASTHGHQANNSSRFHKHHDPPRKGFSQHQPLVIPDPPSFEDQIRAIDMEMDDESDNSENSNSTSSLMEIAKRKKLPVWIREGLEKMKREKELEQARIQEEQRRKEEEENRKKIMEEALKEIEREKKVSKSKYESSDSETEETDSKVPQIKPIENDEDAYEKMMLLVRKTLTSILLEVTDEKIQEISNDTLSKYRKKASATTKPALMKLGLGAYSSSTDEESGDENGDNNSDWESESVIKERIYQKQYIFEKRVKERLERQHAELEEMEKIRRRNSLSKSDGEPSKQSIRAKHSDSGDEADDKKKFKSSRKDGEEKYETMIYSISTSSGPIARVAREKKTRFSDPKDGRSTTQMTHLGMVDSTSADNGTSSAAPKLPILPPPPSTSDVSKASESPKKEKKDKKKRRRSSSTSSSSSDSTAHRKKHKKHKKSSKHSKKSSKKKDKSRSRSRERHRHHSSRSDRHSIESKSSIRSSESSRRRSRSRSRSRDSHRRRY